MGDIAKLTPLIKGGGHTMAKNRYVSLSLFVSIAGIISGSLQAQTDIAQRKILYPFAPLESRSGKASAQEISGCLEN